MDKKLKISKSSKQEAKAAKIATKGKHEIFTLRQMPLLESVKDNIFDELLEWAMTDLDAFKISQFAHKRGLFRTDLYRWCKNNEERQEKLKTALLILGDRREIGAIKDEIPYQAIAFMMPHYDSEWKEQVEWRAKLKEAEAQKSQQPITVVIQSADKLKEEQENVL